jgi:hypothetical protein
MFVTRKLQTTQLFQRGDGILSTLSSLQARIGERGTKKRGDPWNSRFWSSALDAMVDSQIDDARFGAPRWRRQLRCSEQAAAGGWCREFQ